MSTNPNQVPVRQAKGQPTGGQFAPSRNPEPNIDLTNPGAEPLESDQSWRARAENAESTLARIIAAARNQDLSGADFTQEVSDILTNAGVDVDWDAAEPSEPAPPSAQTDEEAWIEKYKPLKNHLNENAAFDGTMFETSGDEYDFVLSAHSAMHVWTLTDQDGASFISPGFHRINRLGYFVTEEPWDDSTPGVDLHDGPDVCRECDESSFSTCDEDGNELEDEDDWDGWRRCHSCDHVWQG